MFDTMTLTKIVGGVCGALLIFLFGNWAAESLYGFGEGSHVEGAEQAYSIAVDSAEGATAEAAPTDVAYTEVAATADATKGEAVFGKCKSCHKIDGSNGTGPHLNGIVGRGRGDVEGFNYSAAMLAKKDEPWTPEALYTFLHDTQAYVPKTKMGLKGIPKPEDRANLIAYLETLK